MEEATCGPLPASTHATTSGEWCNDIISQPQALHALAEQPDCTDAAISVLEQFAAASATARSDLAAAYYLRAQRQDRATDLLRAFEAANRALTINPRLAEARFNRSLILEALGLSSEAAASWDEVRATAESHWAGEAAAHRTHLAKAASIDAEAEWTADRERLPAALQIRDRVAVRRLVGPFPSTALNYLTDEVLPQWAEAPTDDHLEEARILAAELAAAGHDRYALDLIDAITRSSHSPATFAALRKGVLLFRDARGDDVAYRSEGAAEKYDEAALLLERAGNPLSILARLGMAVARSFQDRLPEALSLLGPIERQARERGYLHLVARIQESRAYFLFEQSRYVESLAERDKALAGFSRLGDEENILDTQLASIGDLRTIGQYELSWRQALPAVRRSSRVISLKRRHALLGDSALTALALGYPRAALLYEDVALRTVRHELALTPPERLDRLVNLEKNLAVAYRARADIDLRLDQYTRAEEDLREATRLDRRGGDESIRRSVQARIEEVRGQASLRVSPSQAVAAFNLALSLTPRNEFRTFRASLFAQRAEAQGRLGRNTEAEDDLHAALGELHAEELQVLHNRTRGADEGVWSPYFSRFQDTYRLLIRQLVEGPQAGENQAAQAFAYAEKARAFEPLNLLLQTSVVPTAFRELARGEPLDLPRIQRFLPEGTFVLEYCVLEDRTYVWVIAHEAFAVVRLPVNRSTLAAMTASLHALVRAHDTTRLEATLFGLHKQLLAAPMAKVEELRKPGSPLRLVFVPDGAMSGIPLAALRNPDSRRYLIEEAPVSSAASATLYVFSLFRDRELPRSGAPSALLVGDPAFDPTLGLARGLARLRNAQSEVAGIAPFYAPHAIVLIGAQATVPRFLAEARKSDIIHVAGHAIADADAPFRSLLVLAPSAGDSGALDAESLVRHLQLDRTRLVVLSTCRSAGGLPVGPEGVAPLVRPLLGAGVPAVIGSLWNVDDATASVLLVSFHRWYRKGFDVDVALQQAQLDLLNSRNAALASPLAWAPFEVVGFASSPFGPKQNTEGEPP